MTAGNFAAAALQLVTRINSFINEFPEINGVRPDDQNSLEEITRIQIDRDEPSGIIAAFKQATHAPTRLIICSGVSKGIFDRLNSKTSASYADHLSLHEAFLGVASLRMASAIGVSDYAANLIERAQYLVNPEALLTQLRALSEAIDQKEAAAANENNSFYLAEPVFTNITPKLRLLVTANPTASARKLIADCTRNLSNW